MVQNGRKRCSRCKRLRLIKFFHRNKQAGRDGFQYRCQDCRRETAPPTTTAQRAQMRSWQRGRYAEYHARKKGPCKDCKNTFHTCQMDWDHVRGKKLFNLCGNMFRSREAILKEVAKCDLVCANCHRLRTFKRLHGVLQDSRSA
jgi:hypothetical protein